MILKANIARYSRKLFDGKMQITKKTKQKNKMQYRPHAALKFKHQKCILKG